MFRSTVALLHRGECKECLFFSHKRDDDDEEEEEAEDKTKKEDMIEEDQREKVVKEYLASCSFTGMAITR